MTQRYEESGDPAAWLAREIADPANDVPMASFGYSNTVFPVAAYEGQMTAIVIPMNSNFSVGILNEDSTEAFFPLGFDETDRETALSSARRYSEGFFGPRTDVVSREGYTMPYPIKKRNETIFSHTEGKTIVLIDPGNLDSPGVSTDEEASEAAQQIERWKQTVQNAADFNAASMKSLDRFLEK